MTELLVWLEPAHVTLALASGAGFLVRGAWMWSGSPRLSARWVRIAPHVLDSVLLVTGVALAVLLHLSPLEQPWLAAKLALLVAYVVAGSVALRRGRTPSVRRAALVVAVACYALILVSALSHRPLGIG